MAAARQERRVHRRYELACPITILNGSTEPFFQSRCENVSEGGVYLTVARPTWPASRCRPRWR